MKINQLLQLFGLDDKEQEAYLLLSQYEWATVLELSKKCTIKRTSLYRVIDALIKKGLVEMRVDDKTTYYRATSPDNFEFLVLKKEKQVKQMKAALTQLKSQVNIFAGSKEKTSVSFYRGIQGIMSVEWKLVSNANSEILILSNDQWWHVLGEDFAEKARAQSVKKNIKFREILNCETIKPSTLNDSWTNNDDYIKNHYQGRFIEKKILPIENEFYITNDAIYIYSLNKNDIVGIEIINQGYVKMMKGLFEIVWQQAKKLEDVAGKYKKF